MRTWKFTRIDKGAIKKGCIVPVLQASKAVLRNLNEFSAEVDLSGINLIIDEADNVWSTFVDTNTFMPLQREGELYDLLGQHPLQNSRVRTISLVSATIAPIQWWTQMWHLKPQKFIADDQMLLEKGFADELHLKPVYPMLKSGDIKANKNYGWDHPSFKRVFDEFHADIRPGRLMMVATTPRVNAGDNTVFHQAEMTLADRCPDAACLVVHGGGINLLYRNADDPEAAHGYGVHLKKNFDVKEVGAAIAFIDASWGLQVPIIVFGYHCVGRSKSIRSDKRVITHLIVALQSGKSAPDLKQTIMRFGGFTANVRRENGFTDGVMFLGVQEDLLLFLQYYDFQKAALAKGDDWMSAEYPQRFGPVVQSARKHAKKSLRLDEHLAMTVQKGPAAPALGRYHAILYAIRKIVQDTGEYVFTKTQLRSAIDGVPGYDGFMRSGKTRDHNQCLGKCCTHKKWLKRLGERRSGMYAVTDLGRSVLRQTSFP
ncbi:hypothetical protein CVIRNUC_004565 [Coccomyxa viridis]|uniref:Uncharacterized protein n=1 Tax=Coccomyxa viridis TaxID=1274662 RepID=A0AAV1I4G2_9CHLO|nr:hypothetical protein CVIRNUC_004565 [Coccomyxa viridis]